MNKSLNPVCNGDPAALITTGGMLHISAAFPIFSFTTTLAISRAFRESVRMLGCNVAAAAASLLNWDSGEVFCSASVQKCSVHLASLVSLSLSTEPSNAVM